MINLDAYVRELTVLHFINKPILYYYCVRLQICL